MLFAGLEPEETDDTLFQGGWVGIKIRRGRPRRQRKTPTVHQGAEARGGGRNRFKITYATTK